MGQMCYTYDNSFSGCVPIQPARCLTPRFVRDTFRVALLAAGFWPVICNARASHVRTVQVPVVDRADIRFTHISLEASPVRGNIFRIVQDDQGFLWFGTNHGLLRYDGYQFRAFVHDPGDPNCISGVDVTALFKDGSGSLWIGSDQRLDRYDPASGVFKHFPMDAGDACKPISVVRDITQDRDGMIWLATDSGLKRLDPGTSNLSCYQHAQDDITSLASNRIKTMLESRDGTFWVATSEGLDVFDRRAGKVIRHVTLLGPSGAPLNLNGVKVTLFEDHAGILWITIPARQECGLTSIDPRTGIQSAYLFGPLDADFSIIEDEGGELWFGHWEQGIIRFDRDRKQAIRYRNNPNDLRSVTAGGIHTLMEDREHRVWVGTTEGSVDRFDPRPPAFQTYHHEPGNPNSLSNDSVYSVFQDSHGILWVGGLGGLDRFDRKTGQVTRYAGRRVSVRSAIRVVFAIAEDHAGYLWFGDWGNGLARFDPRTGHFKSYRHDRVDPASLSSDIVESLFVDSRGTLWVGTYDALNRFDPQTERFQVYRDVAGSSQYRAIAEDSSGALWLATWGNGLHRFDPTKGRFTVYRNTPDDARSLSNDGVNTVYVDRSGAVWAGTNNGLSRFDQSSGTFTSYNIRDGLAGSVVDGILEDKRGDLWLSTSNGLSRFNPRTRTFRNYYSADGLPGNEFTFAAASKSSAGEMFFGSPKGLLAFFPERVIDDPSPPAVVLTDFWLFGNPWRVGKDPLKQPISFTGSLTLAPSQNIFSLEFSALSYSNPAQNRYRYRLEGLEKQWNERDSTRRLVTYTTLAPGDYVFRVQGSNSLGVWNTTGASVQIRVSGPWWTWWWVRAAFTLLTLTAMIALYRFRVRRLAYQLNLRLEERVGERTRIARELHDTLLQSFHGSLFLFQAVRNMLPRRPEEAMQALDGAITRAEQAIAEGRDAIQDLRSQPWAYSDLEHLLTAMGQELEGSQDANHDSASFSVTVEGKRQALSPILQDEVYRIARELLRNAFQHAQARQIEAEVRYDHAQLRLRIRDDGKGMDPKVLQEGGRPGHWGLPGIRERAKRIGARLDLWSEAGAGTEIELSIPGSIAYGTSPGSTIVRLFRKKAANS